jgi:hypothetical protein
MLAYTKIKWKEKLALSLCQVWMFVQMKVSDSATSSEDDMK